ncbi:MAG: pirin family protein [Spirochaetia bacterium]
MKKIRARETAEGSGARVRRLFPVETLRHHDPFVLLDEFFVGPDAGFPQHPHRGFEALTYILEGGFRHKDTRGNDSAVSAGGVQWFNAGAGIEHSEMPDGGEGAHGFQLWVNLAHSDKALEPEYHKIEADALPHRHLAGGTATVLAGEGAPVKLHTDVEYHHVSLQENSCFPYSPPPGMRGFIYLYEGEILAGDIKLEPGEAILFEAGENPELVSGPPSKFIVLAGRPHGESIHQHGSFVD